MNLSCAICLYVRGGVARQAITIIDGTATCEEHMGYLAGDLSMVINTAKREEGAKAARKAEGKT